ncbi:MAG: SulP family inorganic anion transporter, partial [Phycisphaeraceae bacterium]
SPVTTPGRRLGEILRNYDAPTARADLLAGLTVAVVEVPQAMAYAYIAGVPPQYGIYTSIFQGFFGALFASNDNLATGPTNTQSLLIAATVAPLVHAIDPADGALYLQLTIALTLVKGLIQLVFAAAKMGNLVRYVSQSVIVGFTAGAGVLIAAGQVGPLLGLDVSDVQRTWPGVLGRIQQIAPHISEINPYALGIGVGALAVVLVSRTISRMVPGPLLAVVLTAAAVYLLGFQQAQLDLVGKLPSGLPGFKLPTIDWATAQALTGGAFALALLGMIETVGIGKSLAGRKGERIDANQEFFAQGMANLLGSFFMNIPGSGSFTRSALNFMAGGRTRLAAMFNSAMMALIFLLLAPQARYIPMASLAAILFVVAYKLIDWHHIGRLVRTSQSDAAVCGITFLSALLVPLHYAIYVGIFLNIALYLRKASHLHMAEMVRSPHGPFLERPLRRRAGEDKVIFLQVEGDLFFGLADELQDRLTDVAHSDAEVVIIRLKRTHSIDATVLSVLEQFVDQMLDKGGHVLLCGIRPHIHRRLQRFGLVDRLGEENVFSASTGGFASAKQALDQARKLAGRQLAVDQSLEMGDRHRAWAYQI